MLSVQFERAYADFESGERALAIAKAHWTNLLNSNASMSKCSIVKNIDLIDWAKLERPLDENILDRFQSRVVNWNAQLRGGSRNFEFIIRYQDRFDWGLLSQEIPYWFNDIHFDVFGSRLDWFQMTDSYKKIDTRVLIMHGDRLDWKWITQNDIRGDAFAIMNIHHIGWGHPNLDTSNLSAAFLDDIQELHEIAYQLHTEPTAAIGKTNNRLMAFLAPDLINNYPICFNKNRLAAGAA
jgi:hypothetical protein